MTIPLRDLAILRRAYRRCTLTLSALLASAMASFAAPTVTVVPARSASGASVTVPAYQRAEFVVRVSGGAGPYANPFDPDGIAIDATVTGPGGRTLRVPAFWYAPYGRRKETSGAVRMVPASGGQTGWRLRVAPTASGTWRLVVTARDRTGAGTSAPITFRATTSSLPGFVRRATEAGKRRYLQFDSGAPYFLVGENVCWSSPARGLADYDDWFGALGKAGGNYARLWMAFSPLESKETGIGRYDLKNAAYFDEVLSLAEKNRIVCMLAFGTYGEFNTGGYFNEGQWPVNPYNAANGGPVPADKPNAFFTDATARKLYRRRLRYLVARYGAFTGLGFWEFWNEKSVPPAWYAEMASYLKANDPYRHLVTNSYSTTGDAATLSLPDMDLTQTHRYGDEGSIKDFATIIPSDARDHDRYGKPHLLGEFGISWRRGDEHFDPKGIGTNLHNALWASALSGSTGGACIWWWDSYVAPKNLYREFTGLARFAAKVDWPRRDFRPISLPAPTVPGAAETFTDMILTPTAAWGSKSNGTVTVGRDGQVRGVGTLLSVLFGPEKQEQHTPLTVVVDLPKPANLVLRILTVSHRANLRVTVDGKTAAEFPFETEPGKGQDFESTKQFPEYGGIYQAKFNKDRVVPLPAGKHVITLENTAGDWLEIGTYTLPGVLSSRYAGLRPLALQDAATGETLLWLQDPASNWANDQARKTPRSWEGVRAAIPLSAPGRYTAEWWDTQTGTILRRSPVTPRGDTVTLTAPAFRRDIALRLRRAE